MNATQGNARIGSKSISVLHCVATSADTWTTHRTHGLASYCELGFTLHRITFRVFMQAQEVLLSTVVGGVGPAERWASVQVLVCARVCTAPVISELLHHLHDSQQHQSGRRERAADLLARCSITTVS